MRPSVYLVTNCTNGKTYVGLTRFPIAKRWSEHKATAKRAPKSALHRAIAKYGAEAFEVIAVATCLEASNARQVERDVIQAFVPDYNQTSGGEFTVGRRIAPEVARRIAESNRGKKRTPEQNAANSAQAKERMADPVKRAAATTRIRAARHLVDENKRAAAARAACADRVWSDESRAKLSASCMGRRYGPEIIDRMREKKKKPVECVDLACSFDSVLEAADATGIGFSLISKVCRGKHKTAGGMQFRFV